MPFITVVISTWQVPFDQVVQSVTTYGGDRAATSALQFINDQSRLWWAQHEGDRSIAERKKDDVALNGTRESWGGDGYEPIEELGYNMARYELWGGESGFHAMIDEASYARLHEEHYKREFDDKGVTRPGYLINAYVAGAKPGEPMTEAEAKKYAREQAEGIAKVQAAYALPEGVTVVGLGNPAGLHNAIKDAVGE